MSNEKGLPARSPKEKKQDQPTTPGADVKTPSVKLYRQGAMFHRPVVGKSAGGDIGLRGEIVGWSSASRRRMREYLLTHESPEGWSTYGVTFTIPGPALMGSDTTALWKWFCREVQRRGWAMVWRVEIQKRNQLHWHALLILPFPPHPGDIPQLWWEALNTLGPCEHVVETRKGKLTYTALRSALPGASQYACVTDQAGGRGAWLRYLQDHSTKAKQEQIPESIGRHWGIVGRKCFIESVPLVDVGLTEKQYAKVIRAMQRLATPSRPNPSSVFGRSLSYSPTRGRWGHSVWFSNPVTMARMCEWAKQSEERKLS